MPRKKSTSLITSVRVTRPKRKYTARKPVVMPIETRMMPGNVLQRVPGRGQGKVWDAVKGYAKTGHDFVKKHRLVSTILKTTGHPQLAHLAYERGYGKRRHY